MRIKKFADLKENEESELDSYLEWYKKEGYITHPDVLKEEDLLNLVSDNVQKAWDEFAEKHHPLEEAGMQLKIKDGRNNTKYLEVDKSYAYTDLELGIFFKTFSKAQFGFFSGREIRFSHKFENMFYFSPYIWTNVHISFEYFGGGSNGASVMIEDKNDTIFYDILEKKWYTRKDYHKKNMENA